MKTPPPATIASPGNVSSFFIFNPSLGPTEETEAEKILFYYPDSIPTGDKLSRVGLIQACLGFTSTFKPSSPARSMRTASNRYVFMQPEPDIWMALVASNPLVSVPSTSNASSSKPVPPSNAAFVASTRTTSSAPSTKTSQAGLSTKPMDEDLLSDDALLSILQGAYDHFRLFHGSLTAVLEEFSPKTLRAKLDLFYPPWLASLAFDPLSLPRSLRGVAFLPVPKEAYLKVQGMVHNLEASFPVIAASCFLYGPSLVYSGLEQVDLRVLYEYVNQTLGVGTDAKAPARFLCGPLDMNDTETPINSPRVYLKGAQLESSTSSAERKHLVVYQQGLITMLVVIEPESVMDLSFYQGLASALEPQMELLAEVISSTGSHRKSPSTQAARFVYYNHLNLALRSSLPLLSSDQGREGTPVLPVGLTRLLVRANADLTAQTKLHPGQEAEVMFRTPTVGWVIGKAIDSRELYVVFGPDMESMVEVQEEVSRLSRVAFGGLF